MRSDLPAKRAAISGYVTLEFAAYLLIAVAAVGLRTAALDIRPLGASEAGQALQAFLFVETGALAAPASPFLFTANAILFFLFGAADAVARAVPIIVGLILVLLPALLRRELGKTGAIAATFLLAFSPTLTFFARQVEGNTVAVTMGLAAIAFFWRYERTRRATELYLAALTAAAALTSGAAVYTLLLAWLAWIGARSLVAHGAIQNKPEDAPTRRGALLWFLFGLALATSTLLSNRAGFAGTVNLFGDWLISLRPLGWPGTPLSLLLVYEPIALFFGLGGFVVFLIERRTSPIEKAESLLGEFSLWALLALVLYSLAANKLPENLPALLVPLVLTAGWAIGRLLEHAAEALTESNGWESLAWQEGSLFLVAAALAAYFFLQFAHWASFGMTALVLPPSILAQAPSADIWILLFLLVLSIIVVALMAYALLGRTRAMNLAGVLLLVFLFCGTVRSLWLLNFPGSDGGRELVAPNQATVQVRNMVQDLEWVAQSGALDARSIPLEAASDIGPIAQWYLRVFPNLHYAGAPSPRSNAQALITKSDAPTSAPDWIYQDYRVEMSWQPGLMSNLDLWRWVFFRDQGVVTWRTLRVWIPQP